MEHADELVFNVKIHREMTTATEGSQDVDGFRQESYGGIRDTLMPALIPAYVAPDRSRGGGFADKQDKTNFFTCGLLPNSTGGARPFIVGMREGHVAPVATYGVFFAEQGDFFIMRCYYNEIENKYYKCFWAVRVTPKESLIPILADDDVITWFMDGVECGTATINSPVNGGEYYWPWSLVIYTSDVLQDPPQVIFMEAFVNSVLFDSFYLSVNL